MCIYANNKPFFFKQDSVIYRCKRGESVIPEGRLLGDWTNELAVHGKGTTISRFYSGGCKNYAYELKIPQEDGTFKSKIIRKLKGFDLKVSDDGQGSLESLKALIDGANEEERIVQKGQLVRGKDLTITSKDCVKRLKYTFDKRCRLENSYETRPWGCVLEAPEKIINLPDDYSIWE
jgi:hypothetical protein